MAAITKEQFHTTLHSAVKTRSIRYSNSFSLSIRWEADDAGAVNNVADFQSLLRSLQLPRAKEVILGSRSITPGLKARTNVRLALEAACAAPGRSLVVVHYAGHGVPGHDGRLRFVENGSPKARAFDAESQIFDQAALSTLPEPEINVDILFILDCCYGSAASRVAEGAPRIVELIAAADSESTVTQALTNEIIRRRHAEHPYVEIADLMESVRSHEIAKRRPTHFLKMGTDSICLPFNGSSMDDDPSQMRPVHHALFRAQLSDSLAREEQESLVEWLRSLPPSVTMELEGIWPTGSQCILLRGAWKTWSRLANMEGYLLVAEPTGPRTHGGS